MKYLALLAVAMLPAFPSAAQHTGDHSVARQWNEVLLDHIRKDFARPTVHSRNLFHTSGAMYDVWASLDATAGPYLLGSAACSADQGLSLPASVEAQRAFTREAITFAAYRMLEHRFAESPGLEETRPLADELLASLGYDVGNTSRDYWT